MADRPRPSERERGELETSEGGWRERKRERRFALHDPF